MSCCWFIFCFLIGILNLGSFWIWRVINERITLYIIGKLIEICSLNWGTILFTLVHCSEITNTQPFREFHVSPETFCSNSLLTRRKGNLRKSWILLGRGFTKLFQKFWHEKWNLADFRQNENLIQPLDLSPRHL